MWPVLLLVLTSNVLSSTFAQSLDSDAVSDVFENGPFGGFNYYNAYNLGNLFRRLQALEYNVRTGAVGGCESGVIGPFSPGQRTGQIKFRTNFVVPPAVSLAVSDLRIASGSAGLNFQIRPSSVSTTSAGVNFNNIGNNLVSAYVSYMACPNNANQPVRI